MSLLIEKNNFTSPLFEGIICAVVKLEEKKVLKLVSYAIREGATQAQVIEAIQLGLDEIGYKFEQGKYSVTDLMMAGMIFEEVLKLPELKMQNIEPNKELGKILLFTIERDLHDIGKSIFKSAALMSGFYVDDIGINICANKVLEETIKRKPNIIAISSILAQGAKYIKEVHNILVENSLRDQVKILVGGLSSHKQTLEQIGIDAYAHDVYAGVKQCKLWIQKGGK